ncbi:hypothetical protein FALBO_12939 [Fusarium albosuccineum]|uniref:Uncharacterized protein n=1 Tax=Fusarium albosuccineum TaxID=1237068 RepID=A0A8H4L347_9HYPO|nr:hypothetical protein FALBO_12939 [Fusarium albosuccineum]
MKLTSLSTTTSPILASTAHETVRRTTESPPEGTILLGGLGHIYISRWIPEYGSWFGIQLEKNVSGLFISSSTKIKHVSAFGDGAIDEWNVEGGGLNDGIAPHSWQANLGPTGRFLVINDFGANSIITTNTKDDAYEVRHDASITVSGCDPHHRVFYPHGADKATSYIVVCQRSNDVLAYSVKYENDRLAMKQI